ncbi:hypothetical protein CTA2_9639 [Colletotrichum tanaceti]|uniref:Uncharacterized protein n=1 Tax=Colletotrichum tanaceti TaxID=1306861 RepID=A0A4U6XUC6_9PEZI|nr:hypothetical protein CTA2_9639 [Colletotrichum tanaceti]TKW59597.1 hypothetical protein CTA1_7837 [Colletotrichum tanaceti]
MEFDPEMRDWLLAETLSLVRAGLLDIPEASVREYCSRPEIMLREHPCRNCLSRSHKTSRCPECCAHCGQDWHTMDACTSSRRNRCRCRPFPQTHLVKRCPVMCNPAECPAPHAGPLVTAMMCKARCCMCGLLGHAGRDCHLKTCRCGGRHLTIDHMPMDRQCAVVDCPRFFCTKHCKACRADMPKRNKTGSDHHDDDHDDGGDDDVCRRCRNRRQRWFPPPKARVNSDGEPNYEYLEATLAWGNSIYGEAIFGKKVQFKP